MKLQKWYFNVCINGRTWNRLPNPQKNAKAMIKVGSRTLIEHIVDHSKNYSFVKFYISSFHLKDKIFIY